MKKDRKKRLDYGIRLHQMGCLLYILLTHSLSKRDTKCMTLVRRTYRGVIDIHNEGVVIMSGGGQVTQLGHDVYLPSLQQFVFSCCT